MHDAYAYGLWSLVLIIFAFSFTHPKNKARLAVVWSIFRFSCGAVYGDVRISADDLSSFWLAQSPLSGDQSVFPQHWAPVAHAAGTER